MMKCSHGKMHLSNYWKELQSGSNYVFTLDSFVLLDLKKAESKLLILLKISYTVMRSQTLLLEMDCIWTVGLCVNVCRVCKGCFIKLLPYILLIRCFVGSALRKCKQLPGMVLILVDICKLSSPDSDLFTNLAHSFLPRQPVLITRSKEFLRDATIF